jgi:hypothetical protein
VQRNQVDDENVAAPRRDLEFEFTHKF